MSIKTTEYTWVEYSTNFNTYIVFIATMVIDTMEMETVCGC